MIMAIFSFSSFFAIQWQSFNKNMDSPFAFRSYEITAKVSLKYWNVFQFWRMSWRIKMFLHSLPLRSLNSMKFIPFYANNIQFPWCQHLLFALNVIKTKYSIKVFQQIEFLTKLCVASFDFIPTHHILAHHQIEDVNANSSL